MKQSTKDLGCLFFVSLSVLVLIGVIAAAFQPLDPHSSGGIERLRRFAQTSQPVIAAIERYHDEDGYYPSQFAEQRFSIKGWDYSGWAVRETDQQYSLAFWMGQDAGLVFSRHADGTCQWDYDADAGTSDTLLPFSIGAKPLPVNALRGRISSSLPHGSPPRTASSRSGK